MGPRVLAAWRRYWFTPASLTNLGVARIILVAIALSLHPAIRYLRVASVAPGLWAPVPLLRMLGIPQPSLQALQWMAHATLLLLLAVGVGVFTRIALALLVPLLLIQEAMANSMGKVAHGTIPLMYAFLFLLLAPCNRAFALSAVWRRARVSAGSDTFRDAPCRESAYARWPLELLFIELAAFYFCAGLSKIRAAGLLWADGYTLQFHLLFKGAPLGRMLASHLWLCTGLSALVLIFELGFPLGMLRRLRPLVLGGGVLFHLGTTYFMNIAFSAVVALYALFVPWTVLGTAVAHRTGLARRRLEVLYDGACGLCRRTVSVIRDLDLAKVVRFSDLSDGTAAAALAADVDPVAVRAAMHVVEPGGVVTVGFDAFRRLAWVLPAAWPALPLLYVPGVPWLGRGIYGLVARRRRTTTCLLHAPLRTLN